MKYLRSASIFVDTAVGIVTGFGLDGQEVGV